MDFEFYKNEYKEYLYALFMRNLLEKTASSHTHYNFPENKMRYLIY